MEEAGSIVVLRPGALGDAVLTLPVLASLKAAHPHARLLSIGSPLFRLAVECGLADEWASADDPRLLGLFVEGGGSPLLADCDLCIAYGRGADPMMRVNLRRSGARRVVMWPAHPAQGVHIVDHLLGAVEAAGCPVATRAPGLPPRAAWLDATRAWLAERGIGEDFAAIHPGSGGRAKRWPVERFAEAARRLGVPVLWLLGPAEAGDERAREAGERVGVVEESPALATLAGLLALCRTYVGNDSGVTHLAAAVSAPTVALFGPTDPAVWGPRGERVIILGGPDQGGLDVVAVDAVLAAALRVPELQHGRADDGERRMKRPRARDLGFVAGERSPGPLDAITDVAGVRVGHATLVVGEGALRVGEGPVRTGVTVVLPHGGNVFLEKAPAAVHTINGFGKPFGSEQVRELGVLESPIALTNTLNVGLVADALVQHAIRQGEAAGVPVRSVNVVVGETNDGYLNDIQGRHVRAEHVWAALGSATDGPVAEGAVGAGTGTVCFGFKGGIGSASRMLSAEHGGFAVGVLVQSNFGRREELTVHGVPMGRLLRRPERASPDAGSVMVVLATDAPLDSRQLGRLCRRVPAGLARLGSTLGHGSGDFVIAFSTARRVPHRPPTLTTTATVLADEAKAMAGLFPAVIECVEEAVLNSLCAAEAMAGRDGHRVEALPTDAVADLLKERGSG